MKKQKKQKKKVRFKCCALCKIGFIEIKPLVRITNEMSCLYLFISPNYAKWFLPSYRASDFYMPLAQGQVL